MQVHNVMEALVAEVLADALGSAPEACACARCRLDMTAFALNNLPPRYVVDDGAHAAEDRASLVAPFRADARYAARAALQMVSARPRHARSAGGWRTPPE